MKNKKRHFFDILRNSFTYIATAFSIIVLVAVIVYVFSRGVSSLSWDFITSDYYETLNVVKASQTTEKFTNPNINDTYFSANYGIALKDDKTVDGKNCVVVAYVAVNSPFNKLNIASTNQTYAISKGEALDVLIGQTSDLKDVYCNSKSGAEKFTSELDQSISVSYLECKKSGGGIRGSLITTICLILLTLVIALPLGIGAAIYLVLYAKEGRLKTTITNMIDATSGIPSIIFGFVGAIIFIPIVSMISNKTNYSILAGVFTMVIVLLPTIIKTTSEALLVVPNHYMSSSLALGASKTQTIFKIILPNAVPGILTAVLLSIGRIIGESAALIFVMGTSISDNVNILNGATSLSLHIWSITRADVPNYDAACAISIIILTIVFLLNLIVKIISIRIYKKRGI